MNRIADIYLSYSKKDIAFATNFAKALLQSGINVWWDNEIIPLGVDRERFLSEKLSESRLVIVLWSDQSIKSKYVLNEALEAMNRGRLIPILIEDVKIPLEFETIQHANLSMWEGDPSDPGFRNVVGSIQFRLEEEDINLAKSTRSLKEEERRVRNRNEDLFVQNRRSEVTIDHFELRESEFFGDVSWSLNPNVNILLGRNGYGKTFLLKTLIGLIQYNDIVGQGALSQGAATLNLTINDRDEEVLFADHYFDESTIVGQVPVLAIPDARFINRSDTALAPVQFGDIDQSDRYDLSRIGAWHFINEQPFDSMIQSFLYGICLDYYQYGQSFDTESFRLMQKVAQELTDSSFKFDSVRRSGRNRYTLFVRTEGNEKDSVPIQKASQGTLSIIAIVGLIFDFLKSLRQSSKGEISDRSGIVIIDEVDAHLHPSWQQKVVSLLRKQFPNVQFILSAHNPIVVAGCLEDEVSVLGKHRGTFSNSAYENSNNSNEIRHPFFLSTFPHDFVGWEPDKIYETVFEIEDPDETFLKYKAIIPFRKKIEADVNRLSSKKKPSEIEKKQLYELEEQLLYIDKVDERDHKKMNEANMERDIQQLKRQIEISGAGQWKEEIKKLKTRNASQSRQLRLTRIALIFCMAAVVVGTCIIILWN